MQAVISIIDDGASIGSVLAWLPKGAGYKARSFTSANTFLAAYDPKVPGCVGTDLVMTGMSGLQLQRALAAREYCPPIVFSGGRQHRRPSHEGGRRGRSLQARAGGRPARCSARGARELQKKSVMEKMRVRSAVALLQLLVEGDMAPHTDFKVQPHKWQHRTACGANLSAAPIATRAPSITMLRCVTQWPRVYSGPGGQVR